MKIERNNSAPLSIIGVGGFTSEVGKTTLVCDLLQAFPNWEAIKVTRGHYRSCGKTLETCCVSHLLSDEPVVLSGREATNTVGKDTGRYWESGAANVHWVIATDEQIEKGIKIALSRVAAEGVLVEGNSFSKFIDCDYFVMVARPGRLKVKTTARQALARISAFYLSGDAQPRDAQEFREYVAQSNWPKAPRETRVFRRADLEELADSIRQKLRTGSLKFRQTLSVSNAS